jgi:tRNA wybutosine-synthesizing protein 3
MTATLKHARPVLAAASTAGFRESGLQSLRCLDAVGEHHRQAADVSPIVAVRSSGLSLESIIGYTCCPDDGEDAGSRPSTMIHSVVTEEYLHLLVSIANERFTINSERIERFRAHLLSSFADIYPDGTTATTNALAKPNDGGRLKKTKAGNWEDPRQRRERKRAEGLLLRDRQRKFQHEEMSRPKVEGEDIDEDINGLTRDLISI